MSVRAGGERSAAAGGNAGAIITGDGNVTHVHPRPPALTALAALLAVVVVGGLILWRYGDGDPDMPPLAATMEYAQSSEGCDGWIFPGKNPEDIPVPPGEPTAEWAHQQGGIDGRETPLRVIIQGITGHDVVLRNMRVVEQR